MRLIELIQNLSIPADDIFEKMNYNRKDVVQKALDADIECGFEAEIVWTADGNAPMDMQDLFDNYVWGEPVEGNVYEDWEAWAYDKGIIYAIESRLIDEYVSKYEDDLDKALEYVESEGLQGDVNRYRDYLTDEDKEAAAEGDESAARSLEEREHWEDREWALTYVENEDLDGFIRWLTDLYLEENDNEAYSVFREEYDIVEWAEDHFSLHDFIGSYGLEEDVSGDLNTVGQRVTEWAEENSSFPDVRTGDYGARAGDTEQEYWRVESDGSIDAYNGGIPAEIISPVYSSPREMLEEMNKLFSWFADNSVETNHSTGIHITMSMQGEVGPLNRLKMALLLGDEYLLKQFDRLENQYTGSHIPRLRRAARGVIRSGNTQDLQAVEKELSDYMSDSKFQSINVKNLQNPDGNNLVEFRIGGGEDYHTDMGKIQKAVVRYSTVMQIGHDSNAYVREYARALFRLLNKEGPTQPDGKANHPTEVVNALLREAPPGIIQSWNMASNAKEVANAIVRTAVWAAGEHLTRKPTVKEISILKRFLKKYGVKPETVADEIISLSADVDGVEKGWKLLFRQDLNLFPVRFQVEVPADKGLLIQKNLINLIQAINSGVRPRGLADLPRAQPSDFIAMDKQDFQVISNTRPSQQEKIVELLRKYGLKDLDDFSDFQAVPSVSAYERMLRYMGVRLVTA